MIGASQEGTQYLFGGAGIDLHETSKEIEGGAKSSP